MQRSNATTYRRPSALRRASRRTFRLSLFIPRRRPGRFERLYAVGSAVMRFWRPHSSLAMRSRFIKRCIMPGSDDDGRPRPIAPVVVIEPDDGHVMSRVPRSRSALRDTLLIEKPPSPSCPRHILTRKARLHFARVAISDIRFRWIDRSRSPRDRGRPSSPLRERGGGGSTISANWDTGPAERAVTSRRINRRTTMARGRDNFESRRGRVYLSGRSRVSTRRRAKRDGNSPFHLARQRA